MDLNETQIMENMSGRKTQTFEFLFNRLNIHNLLISKIIE